MDVETKECMLSSIIIQLCNYSEQQPYMNHNAMML